MAPPHPALYQQSSASQEQRQISRKRENKSVWVPLFAVAEDIALSTKENDTFATGRRRRGSIFGGVCCPF